MQAIILAAGMGKRLKNLTEDITKCMVKVNGVTIIERMLAQIDAMNLNRIVIVVGYKGDKLKKYIKTLNIKTPIEFLENNIYDKTNNIYSLYIAKEKLREDDTLLFESDLIFDSEVLQKLVKNPYPSLALVAKYESWMDGTVVKLDSENNIKGFFGKKDFDYNDISEYYKTVNIYKFGKHFSDTCYVPFLEAYNKALGNNEYYEQVLKVITMLDKPEIKAECLGNESWYEIDDIQDLNIAESIFIEPERKLDKINKRFGGFWRYPKMLDFCYLVNPFFPNEKMIAEIKVNFEELLCNYPSGQEINSLVGAKYYGLDKEQVCIGNGAAEIIKSLMEYFDGKIGMIYPTFEEYPNRKSPEDIVSYKIKNDKFRYSAEDIIKYYENKDIEAFVLINPDNPSGNYIKKKDVLTLLKWAKERKIKFILDESFVDFADEEDASFLTEKIIKNYTNLIVVKSISKSFGVPGLRLGIVASNDLELIRFLKKDMSIWNINSFAEFYLQITEKYKSDYKNAIQKFKQVRKEYIKQLKTVPNIVVFPTEANYVMCEVKGNIDSKELTKRLLSEYNILIKDLSGKRAFEGRSYIRLAVRTTEDNERLVDAMKKILK